MKQFAILISLAILLLATACNRKANQVVTARPATTPAPKVEKPEQRAEIAIFPEEMKEDDRVMESEPLSRAAKAQLARRKAQKERIAASGMPEVMAELRQTGCGEGECPVFTLKIMTDNTLRYEGKANVDLVGNFTGTLPFNPMTRLSILAATARYYGLSASYPPNRADAPADLPSVITTIDYRGQANTVEHIQGGPEKLVAIEDFLRSLVNQATWTEVLPEDGKE